ncbi:MAG: prepilin-type N-terminal cleavage/methylation domain-containing protein, partial [Candidatus Komeilibacteria bacterium]|nr:prepilin-type N-terminal cleavage/methylation domain-containing protein [Candidatus Komeilibacteria bacterium]
MAGHSGFSLVEVIVAIGVFTVLAAGIFNVVTSSYRNFYGTGDKQSIAEFAQEGIEASRAIRDNSWQDIEDIAGDGNKGIIKASEGYWEFSGSSDTLGVLTRTIAISNVERNANDEIVSSGGTEDPNTKKVVVTVSGSGISDYVLTTYFTNWSYKTWEQSDWSGVGDRKFWSDLTMASSSYSNINTSTVGELVLSQATAQEDIYGDWSSFASSSVYSLVAWRPIYDMEFSPDGNTLYIIGSTNTDIRA